MKKRITAILLTFAMVVTAVPTTAFVSAEELEVVETITPDEAVVEEAAPAEVVAEPEAPAEDAVIVEDAVVVEPEAPAAEAEEALDIVEEVVEDGAAEEVAADAEIPKVSLSENLAVYVDFSHKHDVMITGEKFDVNNNYSREAGPDAWETYSKSWGSTGIRPEVTKITWKTEALPKNAYTVTYQNNTSAGDQGYGDEAAPAIIISWNKDIPGLQDLENIRIKFTITKVSLEEVDCYVEGKPVTDYDNGSPKFTYVYDGKPHTVEMTLFDDGVELVYGEDYSQDVYYGSPDSTPVDPDYLDGNILDSKYDNDPDVRNMIKPGKYYLYANTGRATGKNYTEAVRGGALVASWTIEKAEFNNTNISTPKIVLYEDDFTGGVTYEAVYNEIRQRVYNKLANKPWETLTEARAANSNREYGALVYGVDPKTGKIDDTVVYDVSTKFPLDGSAKGTKYAYKISLNNSKYFKANVQDATSLWGELWVVSGTAPLESIVENRSDEIKEELKTAAVYTGSDLKTKIKEAIVKSLVTYPGLDGSYKGIKINVDDIKVLPYPYKVGQDEQEVKNVGEYTFRIYGPKGSKWEGKTYDYNVTVEPKQMAESRSAGRYTAFAKGFTGTALQYVHMDKSAGMIDVTVKDNGEKLKKGTDYDVVIDEGYFNDYVYIVGKGNYKTTRDNEEVMVKLAVQQTGKVNLEDSAVHCVVYGGESKPYPGEEQENAYTVKTSDVEVYEELNGQKYPIPSDCWEFIAVDCSENKHRREGQHWVDVKGISANGYEGTRRGSFAIVGADINDDFTATLTKDTFELTDKPVAVKDLGINVREIVKNTAIIDWWKYFDLRISYTDWNGITYTLTTEKISKDTDAEKEKYKYWDTFDQSVTFKSAVPHTVELIPKKSQPRVEGYSGTLKPGTFTVLPRVFKEWSSPNRQNRIKVSSKERTITWPGRPVEASDFTRVEMVVSDTLRRTKDNKDTVLTLGTDYTVEKVSGGTKAGDDVTFVLTGMHNYSDDTIEVTVKVVKFDLSAIEDDWAVIVDQPYWGGAAADVPVKSIGDVLQVYLEDPEEVAKLVPKRAPLRMPTTDYEVKCVDATSAGRYAVGDRVEVSIAPTDTENYTGSWTRVAIFDITQANIGDTERFEVSGVPSVKAGETPVLDGVVLKDTRNGYELKLTDEYTKAFKQGAGDGEGTLTLTAAGKDYIGTRSVTVKRTLEGGSIDPIAAQTYDGTAKEPTVTVKDAVGDVVDPADYEITYSNNTNAGTAGVTVTVKDTSKGYTGTLTTTFEIQKAANSLTVSPTTIYVAPEEKLPLTVTSDAKDEVVFESADKTVAIVDKDGNVTGVKAGATTTVKVTAGGKNYEAKEATVTVVVKQPTVITAVDRRVVWTGAAQSIDLGAKASSGAALTYTVTDTSNAKGGISVVNGKASVTADFMGEAKVTISAPNTDGYQAATKTISVKVSPEDIKVLKATSKNGKIVVKYSTTNSATKYQLQIADNASFKNARTIKSKMWGDPNKRTVKTKIKKGKTYYVRVRACSKAGKVLFHSVNWSKAVAVKVR